MSRCTSWNFARTCNLSRQPPESYWI